MLISDQGSCMHVMASPRKLAPVSTGAAGVAAEGPPATSYAAGVDWPYYNGSPGGTHYSKLRQINTRNVGRLRLAWTFDTHESVAQGLLSSDMEVNPLMTHARASCSGKRDCKLPGMRHPLRTW